MLACMLFAIPREAYLARCNALLHCILLKIHKASLTKSLPLRLRNMSN